MSRVMNVCVRRLAAIVFGLITLTPFSAAAQTVMDATTAEFTASADHNGTAADGTPLLTSYRLDIYPVGSSTPSHTVNLGKPAPGASSLISVRFDTLLPAPLAIGTTYEARVTAVGPGGSTTSGVSNTFARSAPCAPALSASSASVSAAASSGSVGVTAAVGCAWTATSNASWLTITAGAAGSGNGTVNFSASANTAASPRTGTLSIAGQTFTVNQAAAACTYSITPTSASAVAAGQSASVSVTSLAGCAWTATSNTSWLTITSGANGSGNGTVAMSVAANTATSSRSGTATIAGRTFTVNQAAAPCTYSITPTSTNAVAAGQSASVSVTSLAGCAWTATSNTSWLTITSGANGSGNGTVAMFVAANTATSSRSGTATIAGRTFTVNQAAAPCTYSITPTSTNAVAAGETKSVAVTSLAGCAWTATSNASWLTITSGANGSGNGTVAVSVAANTATSSRTGTATIAGQTFTVNQAAAPCTFFINPGSTSAVAAGETKSVAVTSLAGCAWTATSNASWLTITSGASGSGNGTVAMTVAANTATSSRTGTATIAGQTFTVNQAAAPCTFSINPGSASAVAAGETKSIAVTSLAGCAWTATSNASWLTITSGANGSGNGTVALSVAANTVATSRTGTATIAGQTFTVNQAAAGCTYSINPGSTSAVAAGETKSVAVTSLAGCAWTATSNASWLTITSGASGTGNGTVALSVAANTVTTARTGTATIGGQTFTVNQAAAGCTYSINPGSANAAAAAGETETIAVASLAGCAWTATSNASWLTVTSGASGSGNGTVALSVAANPAASPRTGTATIGGQTFTVNQAAAPCTHAINPGSATAVAAGETETVAVTSPAGCTWTATSNAAWLTVTSGANGNGNGSVAMSVAANTTTTARSGTATIAGQTFTVNQAAAPCSYAINPASRTAAAGGETTMVNVTAGTSCAWTATNTASWVTIANGSSGSGNGGVTLTVAANTGSTQRSTSLTIAGQSFAITQPAAGACTYAISPEARTAAASGESISVALTAGGSCIWSAGSTVTWLLVTAGHSGMGNGTVSVLVSGNSTSSSRTGVVNIAGRTLTVTQPAQTGCSYTVSPLSFTAPAAGATTIASVTAATGCAWTASSGAAWLTVTGGASGSGNGSVSISVAANTAPAQRSGLVTIAGRVFSVTQPGASTCGYTINPTSTSTPAAGGTASVSVTAGTGCLWTAASTAAWIMVSSGASGSGNGSVSLTMAANTAQISRTGTVNIGGKPFTVTQAAAACTYTVTPTTLSVPAFGLTSALAVGTATGCSWTPSGVPSWITMSTATRTGSGQLAYTISANPGTEPRTATLTINGVAVTVTQGSAAPPPPSGFRVVVEGQEPQ